MTIYITQQLRPILLSLAFCGLLPTGAMTFEQNEALLLLQRSSCSDPQPKDAKEFPLGNAKLVLLRCWLAAYNAGYLVTVFSANKLSTLNIQDWDDATHSFRATSVLTNAEFNPRKMKLTAFHKARGIADCGVRGEWTWTGKKFRMSRYWRKDKCDGKPFDSKWKIFP